MSPTTSGRGEEEEQPGFESQSSNRTIYASVQHKQRPVGLAYEKTHTRPQQDGEKRVMQASFVQNHSPADAGQHAPSDPGREFDSVSSRPEPDDNQYRDEAVRAEAATVQAKYMSHVDTTTDVVVRFDFMSEKDTRVGVTTRHTPWLLVLLSC